jgi:hypothetical protein
MKVFTYRSVSEKKKKNLALDRPKAPITIHGPSGIKLLPPAKDNAIADCLEYQFTPHDLCEENHERRVVARVQTLSEAVNDPPPRKRPGKGKVVLCFN